MPKDVWTPESMFTDYTKFDHRGSRYSTSERDVTNQRQKGIGEDISNVQFKDIRPTRGCAPD
jgi:hypothetical protein